MCKLHLFRTEIISALFLWGKREIDAKNSSFDIFESALYMKSVCMRLVV